MSLRFDYVKIKVDPAITQDELGVYIQEEWQTLPPTGEVLEVGPDVKDVKPKQHVFFERYTGLQHPFEEDVRVCREAAIIEVFDAK